MSPDARLQKSVYDSLKWEPSVDAAHVGVVTHDGIVTLTGHVSSLTEKFAAQTAVRAVKGVEGVADELEIRLSTGHTRDDEDLALAAAWSLRWDVSVPAHAVKATVEHGRIALTGEVDWRYQANAAEENVRRLTGVVAVDNRLTIKPAVDASHLQDDITHALGRSWFFDEGLVKVAADEGRVRLTGSVRSPHERQLAAATAWAGHGVTAVENAIVVGPLVQDELALT